MITLLLIAAALSIFSIFTFFGNVLANDLGVGPNMFDIMFGVDIWKMFPGMTVLFALEILLIFVSFGAIYLSYRINKGEVDKNKAIVVSCIMGFLNIVNATMSFLTLVLTSNTGNGNRLGIGPIFYAILQILSLFTLILAIISTRYNLLKSSNKMAVETTNKPVKETVKAKQKEENNVNNNLSEKEKAELILTYKKMLDEGAITQEEYEAKKKQLLK